MATDTLTGPLCARSLSAGELGAMAKNLYGPGVRMGNWNEDVYLEEERMRDFLAKRDEGQLLIQKNRRLKENLLRPMQLSVSEDGYIHYGDKVMLVNPDHPEVEADLFLGGDLSLCMTPDEIKAYLSDELEVPCGLSAAQTKIPVGRNTFTILCAAGEVIGQVVRYGQNFRLGIAGGFEGRMFYLSSDHRTLMKSSKRSWLQEVYLTDEDSYLNCWQAAFPDPQLRLEYEGFPIPYLFWKGSGGRCSHIFGFTQSGEAQEPLDVGDWESQEECAHRIGSAQTASRGHPSPGAGGRDPREQYHTWCACVLSSTLAFQEILNLGLASSYF
uniref:Cilia and flagella associated protein 161 n=1 Tax=Sus scrofa TaxID=9823 RepID=A0A8D1RAT1_PIG